MVCSLQTKCMLTSMRACMLTCLHACMHACMHACAFALSVWFALLQSYPVNLEWDNVASLSPENQEERPWWYNNVHYPTRRAVQRAFEEGVADFRTVIEAEYKLMKEHDRKEGERLAHLKAEREKERKAL